jgi:hypothetical protein
VPEIMLSIGCRAFHQAGVVLEWRPRRSEHHGIIMGMDLLNSAQLAILDLHAMRLTLD